MRTLAIAAALAAFSLPAFAQPQCASREQVVTILTEKFQEAPQMRGMTESGSMIEIWANPETGSWTAVVSHPDGRSCIAADGGAFTHLEGVLKPTGMLL